MPTILSASIIVVRAGAHPQAGLEVLLMERGQQTRNFGGTLVFPGGKVDEGDAEMVVAQDLPLASATLESLGLLPHQVRSVYGAALRETVEEVGLLWHGLGGWPMAVDAPDESGQRLRLALQQGQSWQAACQHLQLRPSVQGLLPWSRWVTPTQPNMSAKRYDTVFFLASAPQAQQAVADGAEAARLVWDTPLNFLRSFEQQDILLAPPQIMTLAHLARFDSADALWLHARQHVPYSVAPVTHEEAGCRMVCFPGDAQHAIRTAAMPGPTRLLMRNQRFTPPGGWATLWE
ncbi:hypothetical protein SAMN02745117_00505 [Lampropedia hyalina DSM 16112]|jgi:8-oxo-dGTP pyrophosphatase MutT (NUDIX family)|uniref:Nudix hydrolase domain-containing protein n=1 Tax=Lampropedia hyalina DSM 16112 TaxID=1122156 RepID=A0A1M4UK51_9BURK|nr:hypothetical protein [Lampropedia hyalina]SHE57067.1 hypothetical protein SAMN02745117_00505 [Lampropedia hyalina DSM 16112]